jgi:holo-[acyl-carrier protein] synthase
MKTNNPVIRGIGNDIVDIVRIRQSIERHGQHFLNRLFTQREQDYCYKFQDAVPHFAGRFAAKEAIAKAFGTGFGAQLAWHDIEILNDDHGRPIVHLSVDTQKQFDTPPHLLISISHGTDYAIATAIWC